MRASHHTRLRTAEAMHLAACCAASCRASSLGLLRDGDDIYFAFERLRALGSILALNRAARARETTFTFTHVQVNLLRRPRGGASREAHTDTKWTVRHTG